MKNRVCVGAITGAFGTEGEVRLRSFCAEPESIASYGPLSSEDGTTTWDLQLVRTARSGLVGRLSGVTTKAGADALRGTTLHVARSRLPDLPEDEFYNADLIGLLVFDTGGTALGRITAVLNHGAGDLLEIGQTNAGPGILLPLTRANVPTIDLTDGRIVIDPPEGVFD
ncbi:MAG: 16S rRNA processing protein RimM [Boseongicola sp. SB0664_bin_43]|uniref:Ribosome maturation factor RimM n=1 Tax=Boseongicola sp. SB0664_bin_43 TaxID=2604844 RepID=A0A6B0XY06_9RHOB|nr:16S rRNA processing protein RimM [Boseongicola sp. SB0664_bin_43]MYK30968.1 16S rRNA processing protein RimM [Boseongicola sp. SB0670_bin_30]